jgi:uncharacterized protein YgiM (DUF1202 family)
MKAMFAFFIFAVMLLVGTTMSAPDAGSAPNGSVAAVPAAVEPAAVDPAFHFAGRRQGFVCRVTTDGGRLNIRSIPSTSGRIVGKLNNGTVVKEIGVRDDWSRIAVSTVSGRRGRVLGWVLSAYLLCGE